VIPTHPFQEIPSRQATIRNRWIVIAICACLALLAPGIASGQASAGITGTITDTSGAVVENATVTVTNVGTTVSDKTVSSSAGTYTFKGLTPGKYNVSVEAAGFKKGVQQNVTIEVSTTPTVNFTLATGATSETVQVTADQVSLNTTQPEMGSTIEPVVVRALPTEVSGRGRQVDALQFLAPGTTGDSFSHRVSGGVDFEQEIVYNGIPVPQPETEGYTTNFNPPFELVSEYRVERSTFSAQYGLGQGALTYQMSSGTNHYHGDGFWINRNDFFDSVGFFNGPAWGGSNHPPTDHENNYGFTVGGPIWIPKIYDGHNKTFGHLSMEWYKQNNLDTDVSTVPSAQEKTGDFSDFVDGSTGALIPIYVPQGFTCAGLTPGQQFPDNKIPASCISATSQTYIPSIPDPDRPGSGIGGLDSNKSYTPFINPHIQHNWGFTVDHNLTAAQSLHFSMWRNTFSNWSFDNPPLVIAPNPLNSMKYEPAKGTVFLANYSYALSPHLVMTAGAGWIGEINNQFNKTQYDFPAISGSVIPPYIVWDGQHTLTKWGTQGSWLQSINRKLGVSLVNNWLWSKGRNTFNMGIDIRRTLQDDNEEQTQGGQFSFSQRTTSVPNTGDPNFGKYGSSFASFLLGIPDQANRSNSQELRLRNWDYSPYIQDDIKLNPKLTVNVGLRWDIQVPFTEENNLIVFFDKDKPGSFPGTSLAGAATQFGNCTGCAGYDRAAIHWGHFGPRLGFAYQINNKMVVQGGFSLAFLNGGAYEYGTNKVAVNYGNLLVGSFARNSSGGPSSSYGSWDDPANIMPNPTATPFSPSLGAGLQINALAKSDGWAPYAQQWNVNLQRQLGWSTLITAAWVANHVIHLPSQNNQINQMNPTYDDQYGDVIDPVTNQSVLADTFSSGRAQAMGFTAPYANFVNDFGGSSTVAQSLTPYPQYSKIFNNFEGFGTTEYNSAQIQVEKRFTDGLSFLAGYTLSHLMDNTSSGFSSFTTGGINKYNQKPEWATSSADRTNTLKVAGTYELPIGPGKKYLNNYKLGNLLGGWQVGWILDYEAGTPSSGCSNSTVCENGSPFPNGFNRPDRNTSVGLSTASYSRARDYFVGKAPVAQMFDPAGFTPTRTQYVIGDAKRIYSELKDPAFYHESLNAKKHFYFGERVTATLSVDYFNAFNRTRFQSPDGNVNHGTFGQVTAQGSQIPNRQGQVNVRVEF